MMAASWEIHVRIVLMAPKSVIKLDLETCCGPDVSDLGQLLALVPYFKLCICPLEARQTLLRIASS